MSVTEQGHEIILEIGAWEDRPFEVQREFQRYRWERVQTFRTKAAAFARAEAVFAESGDNVRVIKAVSA